jgi:hypothetical protein
VATVALIVTGDMERIGLADALHRAFPNHTFLRPQKVDGFTSAPVQAGPVQRPRIAAVRTNVQKFATALVAAIEPGRRGIEKPDFAFGIDDVELANRGRVDAVVNELRAAVAAEVDARCQGLNASPAEKLRNRVKNCCSFHMFAPLPEAYFFACSQAMQATGCVKAVVRDQASDVEDFYTNDPAYLQDPTPPLPSWAINMADRPHHPKRYIEFLLWPDVRYTETNQGVAALRAIRWEAVLGNRTHTQFLRSLFHDLADALQALTKPIKRRRRHPGGCGSR